MAGARRGAGQSRASRRIRPRWPPPSRRSPRASNASRPSARPRTPIAARPTACASRCSRISARSPRRRSRWRTAPKAAGCCAPSSCSSSAMRRRTKRSSCSSIRRSRRRSRGRPLVIRTLDIGGDKPIPYLPLPAEENPALGLRGVRTSLWRPDLLRVQLRAILRVQPAGQCRMLLPMITDTAEIRAVRRMLDEVRRELRHQRLDRSRRDDRDAGRGAARRARSRAKSISCRSAPTTSRSTRWRWIAATPSWRTGSTGCIRPCCG